MGKDYISTHQRMKDGLAAFGFKYKNKYEYRRTYAGLMHVVGFCHATHHEHFVKYYNLQISIRFPESERIMAKKQVNVPGIGNQIGNMFPKICYREYRVAEDDTEETVCKVIDEMLSDIRIYAIPVLDQYTTLEEVIDGIERHRLDNTLLYERRTLLPFLYYLTGRKEDAVSQVEKELEQLRNRLPRDYDDLKFMQELHGEEKIQMPVNRNLIVYEEFRKGFYEYIEVNELI